MRQVLIKESVGELTNIPSEYRQFLGIEFAFGDTVLPTIAHILIMLGVMVIFFILGVIAFSKKKESI